MNKPNVLFLITARGGSKGVPRKNIREIDGLPLVAYKIIAAQRSGFPGRIIVSTDDMEIAKTSQMYGGGYEIVPFIRPSGLASDSASSVDVINHAMDWVNEHDSQKYDYLCLLEPSSPFATGKDIQNALELIVAKNADTLLGMKQAEVSSKFIHTLDENGGLSLFYKAICNDNALRRQDQLKEYTMNGCIYIVRWEYFLSNHTLHAENSIPYIMDSLHSIEIDEMIDFEFAKFCVEKGFIDTSAWK